MAARCICGMAARLEGHEEFFNQTTKLHLWNINEREDHLRASVLCRTAVTTVLWLKKLFLPFRTRRTREWMQYARNKK